MKIKEVSAKIILDSRKEETIEVNVNGFIASAPSGKSKGKHEKPCYLKNIKHDVDFMNKLNALASKGKLCDVYYFGDLEKIEKKYGKKIGANTMFAFEIAILRALASEKKKELWQVLNHKLLIKNAKFPRIISNTIGGGAHSNSKIKTDFQEFLVTCNKNPAMSFEINKKCHEEAEIILRNLSLNVSKNDENALTSDLDNEKTLEVMKDVQESVRDESITHVDVGIDVAASQFYDSKTRKYNYKNRIKTLTREEQINYISMLAEKYNLFYVEDPLDEEDFSGFSELVKKCKCLIVGDDLTTTNLERVRKAIDMNAITGLIIKPNQIGSLIEVRKIFDLCNKKCIKTIVSHRSGETFDDTISDIAFAFQADFIKTPVIGEERASKVRRLMKIEGSSR